MLARVAVLLMGLVVLAPAAVARAQDAPLEESERQARDFFRQAEINFNLGKFTNALSGYQAAYQAKPLTAFLFNIAQCYRYMGKYERARFFYRRYLALEPKTPNRRVVTDLIDEVTYLMKNPPPTPPYSDGAVETARPAAKTRPTPARALSLTAPEPPAASTPMAADLLVARPAPPESAPSRPIYKRWWFWTGLVAVAAGSVVAVVLLTQQDPPHGTLPPIDYRSAD